MKIMKVLIKKASDWDYQEIKEINTLEELIKIYKSLIVETGDELEPYLLPEKDIDMVVTIYDDYIE